MRAAVAGGALAVLLGSTQQLQAHPADPAQPSPAAKQAEDGPRDGLTFSYTSISLTPFKVSLPTVDLSSPQIVRVKFIVKNGPVALGSKTTVKIRFRGRYTDEKTMVIPPMPSKASFVGAFDYRIRPCYELGKKPSADPHLASFLFTLDPDDSMAKAYQNNRVTTLSFTYRDPAARRR